jgi:hypothetical protein
MWTNATPVQGDYQLDYDVYLASAGAKGDLHNLGDLYFRLYHHNNATDFWPYVESASVIVTETPELNSVLGFGKWQHVRLLKEGKRLTLTLGPQSWIFTTTTAPNLTALKFWANYDFLRWRNSDPNERLPGGTRLAAPNSRVRRAPGGVAGPASPRCVLGGSR